MVEQGTLNPKVEGSNPSRPMAENGCKRGSSSRLPADRTARAGRGRAELKLRFEREARRALPPVLKAGGPASALRRSRACLELPAVGGPSCLLSARHLADHQLPGRNLLLDEFELRLMSFAIALESRLLHFQSVAASKHMACCDHCSGASRETANRRARARRGGLNWLRCGLERAYERAGLRARRQVTMTCPFGSTTAVATTHLPPLRVNVSPTFGTFSLSVSSHASSG